MLNKKRKTNNYSKNNHCIDCGKLINNSSKRCMSCEITRRNKVGIINNKRENNGNFKNGNCINYPKCIDCGKELKNHYAKRCRECCDKTKIGVKRPEHSKRMKGKNNPNYGKGFFGKNNPNYINGEGYLPYTKEFTSELREQIRKRDNYECQGEDCSMTQEEHFVVYGRDIEIHHIDHNKDNCKEDNLITLCKQCNIRANYNRDYWEEFYNNKIKEMQCLKKK